MRRPPEMVELRPCGIDYDCLPREAAEAAIRSLRAKLFRERANVHHARAQIPFRMIDDANRIIAVHDPHAKARARFDRIADAIERGER